MNENEETQKRLLVPCARTSKFSHLPHQWLECSEGEIPLRVPHYCDGIFTKGVRK